MELMVGEREHHSVAPDLPRQNKPFVLERPGHHCFPPGIEKAAISFEDLRTMPSSSTGSQDLNYHQENGPSHLSKSDFTVGTQFGTRSQKTTGEKKLTLKLPRKEEPNPFPS